MGPKKKKLKDDFWKDDDEDIGWEPKEQEDYSDNYY
jgi:hypothetical protein